METWRFQRTNITQRCVFAVKSALRFFRGTSLTNISPQGFTNPPSTRCFYTGRKRSFRVIGRHCPACGLHQGLLGKRGLDCVPWQLDTIVLFNVFTPTFMWWKSNDLTTDELSIFLSVADFANHDKHIFCGRREMYAGLNYNKRIKTTWSHSCIITFPIASIIEDEWSIWK